MLGQTSVARRVQFTRDRRRDSNAASCQKCLEMLVFIGKPCFILGHVAEYVAQSENLILESSNVHFFTLPMGSTDSRQ